MRAFEAARKTPRRARQATSALAALAREARTPEGGRLREGGRRDAGRSGLARPAARPDRPAPGRAGAAASARRRSSSSSAAYAEAAREYLEQIDIRPTAKAHVGAGINLARLKEYDEALSHLREAVRLEPDSAQARYTLALVLFSMAEREWQHDARLRAGQGVAGRGGRTRPAGGGAEARPRPRLPVLGAGAEVPRASRPRRSASCARGWRAGRRISSCNSRSAEALAADRAEGGGEDAPGERPQPGPERPPAGRSPRGGWGRKSDENWLGPPSLLDVPRVQEGPRVPPIPRPLALAGHPLMPRRRPSRRRPAAPRRPPESARCPCGGVAGERLDLRLAGGSALPEVTVNCLPWRSMFQNLLLVPSANVNDRIDSPPGGSFPLVVEFVDRAASGSRADPRASTPLLIRRSHRTISALR